MLQSDPTVSYALGVWRGRVYYRDLDVKSPYNTYRNKGLPPGPICNPGRGAFHAVLFPLQESEELYFVARGDGTHIFTTSWEEHLKAIAHVRAQAHRESTLAPIEPDMGQASAPMLQAMPGPFLPEIHSKPSSTSVSKPVSKLSPKAAPMPSTKPISKPSTKPISKPSSNPARKGTSK